MKMSKAYKDYLNKKELSEVNKRCRNCKNYFDGTDTAFCKIRDDVNIMRSHETYFVDCNDICKLFERKQSFARVFWDMVFYKKCDDVKK